MGMISLTTREGKIILRDTQITSVEQDWKSHRSNEGTEVSRDAPPWGRRNLMLLYLERVYGCGSSSDPRVIWGGKGCCDMSTARTRGRDHQAKAPLCRAVKQVPQHKYELDGHQPNASVWMLPPNYNWMSSLPLLNETPKINQCYEQQKKKYIYMYIYMYIYVCIHRYF